MIDATLSESIDAPVVRVGILEAFYLCDGRLVEVGVVLVCGAEEAGIGSGDDLLVNPVVLIRWVEVEDGLSRGPK